MQMVAPLSSLILLVGSALSPEVSAGEVKGPQADASPRGHNARWSYSPAGAIAVTSGGGCHWVQRA
jgi:hypothetical protein